MKKARVETINHYLAWLLSLPQGGPIVHEWPGVVIFEEKGLVGTPPRG